MYPLRLVLVCCSLSACGATAQDPPAEEKESGYQEFKVHENGLIYDASTMSALKHIVDSMNIRHRKCDVWKTYYSYPQAVCHVVRLDTGNIKGAINDMKASISYNRFIEKYPHAKIQEKMLAIAYLNDYDDKTKAVIQAVELGEEGGNRVSLDDTAIINTSHAGQWIFDYWEGSEYVPEAVTAFYLLSPLQQKALPAKYASMIQYADCMVDTTAQVYIGNARSGRWEDEEASPAIAEFVAYADRQTSKPDDTAFKNNYEAFYTAITKWQTGVDDKIREAAQNPEYRLKLNRALKEAYSKKVSTSEFEYYAAPTVNKDTLLFLKRCRIVVGGCSMDQAPRYHALEIAKLSAEAVNWEVFLRSHLDVMNDNFERVTDGNYAWGSRQTYIGELEALEIEVTPLLLGISLRIDNPAGNHYFGSIGRLGRAMSESREKQKQEDAMVSMISDPELDDFNRILIAYLFRNCLHHVENKETKNKSAAELRRAIATMPPHYSSRLIIKEE